MDLKQIAKNLGGTISKNSPTILTVVAVGGVVTTAVLAVKATPKALQLLDDEVFERQRWEEDEENPPADLSVKDIIRITYKCYLPACGVGLATIVCIIGANTVHLRRTAALAGAYTITETALKEYQAKVVETIGKNKELKIRDEIASDHIKKNPPSSNEVILTGKGEMLCYDNGSGRYFKHDIEDIRRIENRFNKQLLHEDHLSLNDLYYELGLTPTTLGEDLGWHIETGMLEFKFSSTLAPSTDEPCLVIDYNIKPTFRY